jgi:predicted HicB family RNase H-like nuclease
MSISLLEHKGYLGAVQFDAEEAVLRGRIVNIDDVVTFQGATVPEVMAQFKESVEDYLEQCAELGQDPDRPFSGRLTLRMKPQTHRVLQTYAKVRGKSLNGQIARVLDREAIRIQKRLGRSIVVEMKPARGDRGKYAKVKISEITSEKATKALPATAAYELPKKTTKANAGLKANAKKGSEVK